MEYSPARYGLSSRVKLIELGSNHVAIVRLIKSRIIQSDAQKIIEIAQAIRTVQPELQISLVCKNNICAKSVNLLQQHAINIVFE